MLLIESRLCPRNKENLDLSFKEPCNPTRVVDASSQPGNIFHAGLGGSVE